MRRVLTGVSLLALCAQSAEAQFPRIAPPPPCRATVTGPAYLDYWSNAGRDARPKIAVFSLQPDVDDASKVYLAAALPDRIRERLSFSTRLRVATEGSVARSMSDARQSQDSAAILLQADYVIAGRLLIVGARQEVEVGLYRRGKPGPIWQASFKATTSLRSVEDAIVRGLSRALGLPNAPGMEKGWPLTDAGHEAILAGDAHMRSSTLAGSDSAIVFYERALALEPGSPIAAVRLARASVTTLERGGEIQGYPGTAGPRRVNELIGRALSADSIAEAWTVRAMLARAIDPVRFAGALDAHARAIRLDPTDSNAEHEYGMTLLRLGDTRGAETHFRRALSLRPGRPDAFAMLAWMELQAERYESACVLSNASIAAWPFDAFPYAVRAESRLHLADARDAFSDSELVRRLSAGAWGEALRVLIAVGASNIDEARRQGMGLTASFLAPGNQLTVRDAQYMALAYLTLGDQRRAIESLRRARPVGADLRSVLKGPRLAAIRSDTAVVRLIAESEGRYQE